MSLNSQFYTLSSVVDEYLILRGIEKKKYYSRYLIAAKWAYKELFWQTQFMVQSQWMEVKAGSPLNYIDIPSDLELLMSVCELDRYGNVQELYHNTKMNILKKPEQRTCECKSCGGSDLNDTVNEGFQVVTKKLFTVSGIDYYEKTWLKYTKNGDIIRYAEIPTKKYNDTIGDVGGDYNDDYNDDYNNNSNGFSNFEIVTVKEQEVICKLDVNPCGCPIDKEENRTKLCNCGSGYFTNHYYNVLRFAYESVGDINPNEKGFIKVSNDENRIYFKHSPKLSLRHKDNKTPDFLLVNYQTNGEDISGAIVLPQYSVLTLFSGIDFFSKRFNARFNINEKKVAEYDWENAKDKLFLLRNRLSISELNNLKDTPIRW